MAEFNKKTMDDAANDASIELETIREKHADGVKAIEAWAKNGYHLHDISVWGKY